MPVTTDLDKFRLELGDTDASDELFTDDQANYFLGQHPGNVLLAVADACDSLARRFAREFDFDASGQRSFKRSQKAEAYRKMAGELRQRAVAGGGVTTVPTVRVDGYSDDIDTREGAAGERPDGHVRHGYYDPDTPP